MQFLVPKWPEGKARVPIEVDQRLPPARQGGSAKAKEAEASRRFHMFTDGNLHPKGKNPRFGDAAVGGILVDAKGKCLGKWGQYIGPDTTNNIAELKAIQIGLKQTLALVEDPRSAVIVVHTDSTFAYRGLQFSRIRAGSQNADIAVKIHSDIAKYHGVVCFEKKSAANKGIRAAETQARKALTKKLGLPYVHRSSKARKRRAMPGWDPFKGETGWF